MKRPAPSARRPPPALPPGEVRPRSLAEILDDGWELALADAPVLLALLGLFQLPAFAALLLVFARPAAGWSDSAGPAALAALLLPLTGVGSGACQELFRRRAEGAPAHPLLCLGRALRRGPDHAAARAAVLAGVALGLACMALPGFAVWTGTLTAHALLASGRAGPWAGLPAACGDAAFDPGKASLAVLVRPALLLLAALNLHLLLAALLWAAGNLGGLDVSPAAVLLDHGNPAYLLALVLVSWYLLSPFYEAVAFLLEADRRARREGLDLLVRVRRVFGSGAARAAGVLAVLAALLAAGPAAAQEGQPRLSRDEIKSFLRREGVTGPAEKVREAPPREAKPPPPEEGPDRRPGGASAASPVLDAAAGFGRVALYALAGAAVAVVTVALVSYLRNRPPRRPAPAKTTAGVVGPAPEPLPHEQPASAWWRRAEDEARAGRHREAVRAVYQAVLAGLHERALIRCERTRTDGEYVDQVRRAAGAPPGLAEVFGRLTERFESYWYGGAACGAADYGACLALGREVGQTSR